MFSQTTEYSLRVIVFLASLKGVPATTRQIAATTRVPEGYLSKILQNLSRANLIRSQRGLHGGSVLTRDPAELTVYDVVEATGPMPRIRSCPLALPSHGSHLCALHRRLDDAMAMVEQVLHDCTLADLLGEINSSIPLKDVGTSDAADTRVAEAVFRVTRGTPLTVSARKPAKRSR